MLKICSNGHFQIVWDTRDTAICPCCYAGTMLKEKLFSDDEKAYCDTVHYHGTCPDCTLNGHCNYPGYCCAQIKGKEE
jgi:hypothetical protein